MEQALIYEHKDDPKLTDLQIEVIGELGLSYFNRGRHEVLPEGMRWSYPVKVLCEDRCIHFEWHATVESAVKALEKYTALKYKSSIWNKFEVHMTYYHPDLIPEGGLH